MRGINQKNVGLIPACAGKTLACCLVRSTMRAHPRVCGENVVSKPNSTSKAGSSPRVRGKLAGELIHRGAAGLIPACAGKTGEFPATPVSAWAHPRVCGENSDRPEDGKRKMGSSPRVRGKLPVFLNNGLVRGLIPACAGKTDSLHSTAIRRPAHPRVCGENTLSLVDGATLAGSSPRVRGKPPGEVS